MKGQHSCLLECCLFVLRNKEDFVLKDTTKTAITRVAVLFAFFVYIALKKKVPPKPGEKEAMRFKTKIIFICAAIPVYSLAIFLVIHL